MKTLDYLILAGAVMAGAAQAAEPAGPCFRTSEMRNHTIADDRTLFVDVGGNVVYRVGMSNACLAGAMPSDPLVIKTPPSSGLICKPIDLDVGVSRGGFVSHCIVSDITRLTPAEVAALPPKLKP